MNSPQAPKTSPSAGAMAHPAGDGQYAALAPAEGEVFGAWGEFIPWPRYPDVDATVHALHSGLATRGARDPLVHQWSLLDADGATVARLVVTALDPSGLLGTVTMEMPHPLADATRAARAEPRSRHALVDEPETWSQVDPAVLASLTARSETGYDLGRVVLRVRGDQVWWAGASNSAGDQSSG